ncbi:MAG: hypothetical protein H0W49_07040 [Nitrospirales bacterium]|nr:hypothetical protein [Nitrospirales bacterium]MBA3964443.1 hypothetical protein [Nitrospirales bacterium]
MVAPHWEQVSPPFRTDPHFVQIKAGVNSIGQGFSCRLCSSVVAIRSAGFLSGGSIGLV